MKMKEILLNCRSAQLGVAFAVAALAVWVIDRSPPSPADILQAPAFFVLVRFFDQGVHAGRPLAMAINAGTLVFLTGVFYAILRLLTYWTRR